MFMSIPVGDSQVWLQKPGLRDLFAKNPFLELISAKGKS